MDCLLEYKGDAYFMGSLSEPMSCIVGAFHASYHTRSGQLRARDGHQAGREDGNPRGGGPDGPGRNRLRDPLRARPSLLVVTDIDDARLKRAASIHSVEEAETERRRAALHQHQGPGERRRELLALTGGSGYDDVFVFAPVKPVVEQGDKILGKDGCLNFFAGPTDPQFSGMFNFYNVHYNSTHIVGTTGGNTDDMIESLALMSQGTINPSAMITHIGGLNAVAPTTLDLPNIPGGKKLIYTNIDLPLTAIDDFDEMGKSDPLFAELAKIVGRNNGLWNLEAEEYLLSHAKPI